MTSETVLGRSSGSRLGLRRCAVGSAGTRCQSRSPSLTVPTSSPASSKTGAAVIRRSASSAAADSTVSVVCTEYTVRLMMSLTRIALTYLEVGAGSA
jgi:hypothetical protein